MLNAEQFRVTQKNGTEAPGTGKYLEHFDVGIYVDIVSSEPLFFSSDKYESGCGWPAFSQPINNEFVNEFSDRTYAMDRVEIRSHFGDSHLGHVFTDGPPEKGGLRYCVNSASLRFVPLSKMEEEGYGDLIDRVKKENDGKRNNE